MPLHFVILSYNHPQFTERCVRSTLPFTTNPAQVTLIHNGSSTETVEKLKSQFPSVLHHISPENKGYSGGVNQGLKIGFAKNDWVCFLTNDCELKSLPLGLAINAELKSESGLELFLAPHIYFKNSGKTDSTGGFFWPSQGKLAHSKSIQEFDSFKITKQSLKYLPGSAFIINRKVFEKTGVFDERLGTFWEDVDFSARAQLNGFKLTVASDFKVTHAGGKTTRKNSLYTTYFFQRNRLIVSRRYCSGAKAKISLLLIFTRDWVSMFIRATRKRNFEKCRHLLKVLKYL
jgi:GT2 family glycosyltransferase